MTRRPRLLYITTLPVTPFLLLRGQLAHMQELGFDVHVISSPGPELDAVAEREGVTVHPVPIPRDPAPRADLRSLARLVRTIRRIAPDIVNASTPKAGLLGMVAARIARVPVRIYLLRGLRLETATGKLRTALELSERAASACSHQVVSVSDSLREVYLDGGFTRPDKCRVLGSGSSNGVSPARFTVTDAVRVQSAALREQLEIPPEASVIGFAGRMVEDKGILYLLDAFDRVCEVREAHLVLVGDSLAGDSVRPDIRERVQRTPRAHVLPRMAELAPFYNMLDVLAFPSLREGFPNVPAECALSSTPVVGFRSTGVVDAIADGLTGKIVPHDAAALATALLDYLEDPELARAHGEAGRQRILREFSPQTVWSQWANEYIRMLGARGLPLPRYGSGSIRGRYE